MKKEGSRGGVVGEFLRYAIVGGVSFLADTGTMALCKEGFFSSDCTPGQMSLCVAAGFFVGLLCNYLLSTLFVFLAPEQKKAGKSLRAFLIYALVGLVGFGLTELLMLLGVSVVGTDGFAYLIVKCFVAGVVLVWNYLGRKIFVYRGK